ncbi:MAG: RDD family protein [Candidatus Dormibacteraeota bacterium]|nr:RDD family protein [Candidatus Dormibacteraeota bacterium]
MGIQPPPAQLPAQPGGQDLVVSTPELVTFSYDAATLGSRFLAQLIDLLAVGGAVGVMTTALFIVVATVGPLQGVAGPILIGWVLLALLLMLGYFPVSEAVWSGKTLGKLAMRLRAVDARGGPLSTGQAIVRNLLRLIDFLPLYYAVGAVTMFINKRGQRLGDLAAGTVVVRERQAVSLPGLILAARQAPAAPPAPAAVGGRRLEPALRRFVAAYAQRRWYLHPEMRVQLAQRAEAALRAAAPELVAAQGPLAALERLADESP